MCKRLEEHFVAVLEGERRPGFDRHLRNCPKCRTSLERLTLLDKELKKSLDARTRLSGLWPR